ncbi:hypothetical protein AK812_SmicGene44987 [Symbiodinium microadriaticum]|uniref:Uncharacterized protein n=1 Tax=Symbiodinium microadriaticum TaxID=2951 RepID=A0A1Q9BX45_SYMMI|nr:hypothetical protein AK812_SmicGene44987 [Symbiodinium microadriaticum]
MGTAFCEFLTYKTLNEDLAWKAQRAQYPLINVGCDSPPEVAVKRTEGRSAGVAEALREMAALSAPEE